MTRVLLSPAGIRIGTPALTTRGMKENDMEEIAEMINKVISNRKMKSKMDVSEEVKILLQSLNFMMILK